MSPENQQRVRESWQRIETDTERFAGIFYARLFEADPTLRAMFASTCLTGHQQKFVAMIRHIVAVADDPPDFVAALAASGRRHAIYGALDAHYPVVGAALLGSLDEYLGPAFDVETKEAWRELYTLVSAIMLRGARI